MACDSPFKLLPLEHHAPAAFIALQADVRAGPANRPVFSAARMRLAERNPVPDLNGKITHKAL